MGLSVPQEAIHKRHSTFKLALQSATCGDFKKNSLVYTEHKIVQFTFCNKSKSSILYHLKA